MKRVKGWIYATKWFNCSMRTNEAKLHHRDTGGRGKCGSRDFTRYNKHKDHLMEDFLNSL